MILPKFAPVIHVTSNTQALEQAHIAFDNGANGIFLINHKYSYKRLLEAYSLVRYTFPSSWIGLNFLDLEPMRALLELPLSANGIWTDSQGYTPSSIRMFRAALLAAKEQEGRTPFVHYAGTAVKYQPEDVSDDVAAVRNNKLFDVVCTSGDATGHAASVKKIKDMRNAIGTGGLLAVASGITPNNVLDYKPFVNSFLVATGISTSFDTLDPALVRDLADKLSKA